MLRNIKIMLTGVMLLIGLAAVALPAGPAWADETKPADSTVPVTPDPALSGGDCSDVSKCDLISKYISPFVNFLAALVGVGVVISIIIGGIQYGSSAGDSQKVTAAKARIRNAVIALVAFIFLYTMLNFLVPGGLL